MSLQKKERQPCPADGCPGHICQQILLEGPRGEICTRHIYDIPPELEEQCSTNKHKQAEELPPDSSPDKAEERSDSTKPPGPSGISVHKHAPVEEGQHDALPWVGIPDDALLKPLRKVGTNHFT
jgi:hypothetical protein